MKFLQSHDDDFDVCRSFLVVSMVFTHVFEMFYIPDYNRHLTFFVTIGFVFLSGFTIGVLYRERFLISRHKYWMKLVRRGVKLFVIFIMCNAVIYFIKPFRLKSLLQLDVFEMITALLLGTKESIFGFDLLIPIALTSFLSGFLLSISNKRFLILFLFMFSLFLWISESANSINYYGVKTLIIGLIGCCLGILSSNLDWKKTIRFWSQWFMVILSGTMIFLYYATIVFIGKKSGLFTVYYHLIPTVSMIFFVYILSNKFQLSKNLLIQIPNGTLSKNMLFAYLFHIFVINLLFYIIPRDSLDLHQTLALAIFILYFTIAICYFIDFMNAKSRISNKIYSSVFRI